LVYYDAHNHLQDEHLEPYCAEILTAAECEGIRKMVVNGASESDWADVAALAASSQMVIPSFGYHPWYVRERSPQWQDRLIKRLDQYPLAGVGEIGLDRWIKDHNLPEQEEVFVWQLRLAAKRNRPVSIHCLQAWGRLLELLRREPRPDCGFVLHSFGGPREMIAALADLGGYFSLPGYFALERKDRQREAFRHVPPERLLIETDAPDQCLPAERVKYPLSDSGTGKPLNHPANLPAIYQFGAELLGVELSELASQVEQNFLRLFGPRQSKT
jgi:TatD DNase family protein